ncbi:MAG TPA: YggT family protein [Candidatus Deferrimicrobiaceae bacterium]|nr:YggT family protein [Candidatus Deferrimicrobiaceae bacterium]
MFGEFFVNFARFVLMALWLAVLGRVLISWVDPTGRNSASAFLIQLTEPILAPVRRFMPRAGMFDFSPLIVILILGVLIRSLP